MGSKAKQLASLSAVGVSAIALTGGKAEATTIVSSGPLNITIGYSSNATPSGFHTASAHIFNTFASGPNFRVKAVSSNSGSLFTRHVSMSRSKGVAGHSTNFDAVNAFKDVVAVFSAGATWGAVAVHSQFPLVAERGFGVVSSAFGATAFTDKYFLFRFKENTTLEYGWIEASLSVTQANSAAASNGPNLTIEQYAFDTSGAFIAAGAVQTPEPASIAETGLGALLLGAEGLRRWRRARRAA